ncbi:DUF1615 domain-containing protein [Chitinimonas taiwanensis]|uniref:DUF1615 domain-containing protein n=1 Tax=Chitinimonas taiwanensis TaxID=240412 RepID=UPI00160E1633
MPCLLPTPYPGRSLLLAALITGLVGCASSSQPQPAAPIDYPNSSPSPEPTPAAPPAGPLAEAPPSLPPPEAIKPAPSTSRPASQDPRAARQLLNRLLPAKIPERAGWAQDIFHAFEGLQIPYTAEYFCAAIATIEQESSWQSDPVVPGLNRMVWQQIGERADKYGIPMSVVKAALGKTSPNGRSYRERIDGLRTEKQMNLLFEDMSAEAKRLGLPLNMQNPIRTGGPMQVSVAFASGHAAVWPYPYSYQGSLRHEVFTRRGGTYFGIANLLHYRAPYRDMHFRFADYNAGRYSSRNAAFQAAVASLVKPKLDLDGDLLRYEAGRVSRQASSTLQALHGLAARLKLSRAEIERDLLLEKEARFEQSPLYQRVFALADGVAGKPLPRAVFPQIRLHSPKISRKLTTEWFAKRVDWRYRNCLSRVSS